MNYSILNNNVERNEATSSIPLSPLDEKKLNNFFNQGTFNEKLDSKQPETFLSMVNGGLEVTYQAVLKHLHSVKENFDRIKPESIDGIEPDKNSLKTFFENQKNNPFIKQGLESIQSHYELFEQNFSELGDKIYKHLASNNEKLENDEVKHNIFKDIVNAAKGVVSDLSVIPQIPGHLPIESSFKEMVEKQSIKFADLGKDTQNIIAEPAPTNESKPKFTLE